ncbi:MAG TPA: aldo/keto reductase [Methylocella sp.]|jgi:aryl-alcohol dehydrogenase-like predicted oxidoreductase|nr:aldo/keto reductase [Methylocella sp.]
MRTVVCPGLGRDVSALGFGCASLGSRVSEAQGLRALGLAFERGVTWYDVAPPYGDGEAEGILGKFLAGRRDRVAICTKFGIPRPIVSPAIRLIRPWARAMARTFPQLRGGKLKARAAGSRDRLRAEQIESSVVESLRRLRTDYIDVLALHEPGPRDCASEAILRELLRMIEKGYMRCVAIAGAPEAILAGARASELYKIAQLPDDPFMRTVAGVKGALAGDTSLFFVTHSVFGAHERLSHLLVGGGGRLGALASQLGYGPPFMASEMILDYAFAVNPEGVVLASMFTPAHIEMNCSRAARPPRKDIGPFMQKFVVADKP